jgi:hypothetical protein
VFKHAHSQRAERSKAKKELSFSHTNALNTYIHIPPKPGSLRSLFSSQSWLK